jgi:hypothetical protein
LPHTARRGIPTFVSPIRILTVLDHLGANIRLGGRVNFRNIHEAATRTDLGGGHFHMSHRFHSFWCARRAEMMCVVSPRIV